MMDGWSPYMRSWSWASLPEKCICTGSFGSYWGLFVSVVHREEGKIFGMANETSEKTSGDHNKELPKLLFQTAWCPVQSDYPSCQLRLHGQGSRVGSFSPDRFLSLKTKLLSKATLLDPEVFLSATLLLFFELFFWIAATSIQISLKALLEDKYSMNP